MNKYREMRERQQKEFNEFPMLCAYSMKQLEEEMAKHGVKDTSELVSVFSGCFIKKTDREAFHAMFSRLNKELEEAYKDDKFLHDAFYEELANHEFCITGDWEPTIDALGISLAVFDAETGDERVQRIAYEAKRDYMASVIAWEAENA